MKKIYSFLFTMLFSVVAFAYDVEIDGIFYNLDNDNKTAEVTYQYTRNPENYSGISVISIPEKINYNAIEYTVTSIGSEAFAVCVSLTSIEIPNSVTSLGYAAFAACVSLPSITIPNSVTEIGASAFDACSSLASIIIPNSVTSIGGNAFYDCSSLTSIVIGNGVTGIGNGAFRKCSSLTSITIPNSVTLIENYAFEDCSSLTSIVIGNGVTEIGNGAFRNCSSLTSITIPNSVTEIGASAFYACSSLTSITIPNSVTEIGYYAFYGTPWLNNQPDGCVYINNRLYMYKGEMPANTHIDVKEGTTHIFDGVFYNCSSLISITIPNSVTSIGDEAFSRCSSLTSIEIPNSVTSIGSAFQYCSSLTSITIPNSVTSIDSYTFFYCSSLTSITIPNSVTSIGWNAFMGCLSLTSITIPSSVTSIGEDAFYDCSSLTSIICLGSTPPEARVLEVNASTCTLIVPKLAYNAYFEHDYWGQFLNIETIDVDYKKLTTETNNVEWGIVEGGDYYDNGTEAVLTATANPGYRFVKWSDEIMDNPRTVVVTQDSTFTAIFAPNILSITTSVNDETMGSVTEGGNYQYGTEIILTASASDGYRFAQWSDGNTDNPRTITVTETKEYVAEFEVEVFGVFAASEVPSMGGVEITLTARPIEGFEFVEWTDGNTDNPRILILTENIEVYARFQMAQGETPVDLETSKISSANIYTNNGILHVEDATENYHVLDAAGRLIYIGRDAAVQLPRGVYVVAIGGEVQKVVI